MYRMLLIAVALAALGSAARAEDIKVHEAGTVTATDPDGNSYAGNRFAILGKVEEDGSASGNVEFRFEEAFSAAWGAVPGVDFIHLKGKVTSGSVNEEGTLTLRGALTEVDFSTGVGVVFAEENVPFEIVIDPESGRFTLQWCELPTFLMEVTTGNQ